MKKTDSNALLRWWIAIVSGVAAAIGTGCLMLFLPHPHASAVLVMAPLCQGVIVGWIAKNSGVSTLPGAGRAAVVSSLILLLTVGTLAGGTSFVMPFLFAYSPIWTTLVWLGAMVGTKTCVEPNSKSR